MYAQNCPHAAIFGLTAFTTLLVIKVNSRAFENFRKQPDDVKRCAMARQNFCEETCGASDFQSSQEGTKRPDHVPHGSWSHMFDAIERKLPGLRRGAFAPQIVPDVDLSIHDRPTPPSIGIMSEQSWQPARGRNTGVPYKMRAERFSMLGAIKA